MARPKKDGAAPKKRGRPPKDRTAQTPKQEAAPQPQPSPASAGGSGGEVIKLPAKGVVSKLVKSLDSMAGDIRQTTSEMGERVAKAVENQHVDKTALRWVRMVAKKMASQPKAGALSYNHFLAYLDELKISQLADEALGMDLGEGGNGDDESPEDQGEDHLGEPPAEPSPSGKPGLSIVPGPNAPTDVPPAPGEDTEQAA